MRVVLAATALPLLLMLGACSGETEILLPGPPESSPSPTDTPSSDAKVTNAPKGYGARLTITEGRANLLTVRTLGSSSCPFEIDSVKVVGRVIEVADLPDQPSNLPCSADRARSSDDYVVPDPDFESFQAARSVIVTDATEQRLRIDLNFAME